jgi:hypothetical protein
MLSLLTDAPLKRASPVPVGARARKVGLLATTLAVVSMLVCAQLTSAGAARPLKANLVGVFAFGPCPAEAPAGALCLHDEVSGRMSHLGRVTGQFDVVIDAARTGADNCAPISKRGSFYAANGDRLDLLAKGTFCFATAIAQYTYTFGGGSGRFGDATGTGTWTVPAPSTFDGVAGEGDEFLEGTLSY